MASIDFAPRRSMAAKDIRDLQRRARHALPRFTWAVFASSSFLRAHLFQRALDLAIISVATRV